MKYIEGSNCPKLLQDEKGLYTLKTSLDECPVSCDENGENWELEDAPYGAIQELGQEKGYEYTMNCLRSCLDQYGHAL